MPRSLFPSSIFMGFGGSCQLVGLLMPRDGSRTWWEIHNNHVHSRAAGSHVVGDPLVTEKEISMFQRG